MKKSRFTEEQMVAILLEAGRSTVGEMAIDTLREIHRRKW